MNWDDEYDDMDYASHRDRSTPDKSAEGGFNPMDIANPISGTDRKKMKCRSCGHRFMEIDCIWQVFADTLFH